LINPDIFLRLKAYEKLRGFGGRHIQTEDPHRICHP